MDQNYKYATFEQHHHHKKFLIYSYH